MGRSASRPDSDSSPAAVWLWLIESHVFSGLCPDELEGWDTRDPGCVACYATDIFLSKAGLARQEPYLDIFWEDLSEFEISCVFTSAQALVDLGEDPGLMLTLFEGAAWACNRLRIEDYLRDLTPYVESLFPARPDLRDRWNALPGRYLLCDPASFVRDDSEQYSV